MGILDKHQKCPQHKQEKIMKKSITLALMTGIVLASAASWAGFGIPKVNTGNSTVNRAVNTGVDTAKNKGLEKVINDKIAKHNCSFKDAKTVNGVTCDLNKLITELSNWRTGLESSIANDVNINVQASAKDSNLAWERGNFVSGQIREKIGYWDYYVTSNTHNDRNLKIWVTVH